MSELCYKPHPFDPKNLIPNECCIVWQYERWMMYFCFNRVTDGVRETRAIPVNPRGRNDLPGAWVAWGLNPGAKGGWQITPSILCWEYKPDPEHPEDRSKDQRVEAWHETPLLVNVPEGEPWQ